MEETVATTSDEPSLGDPSIDQVEMLNAVAEFSRLDHYAHKTYRHCHDAGEEYGDVAHEVHKLHNVLRVIKDTRDDLQTRALKKNPAAAEELMATSFRVRLVLEELDAVIDKFESKSEDLESMSAAKRKIWLRVRHGSKQEELVDIRFRLIDYTHDIASLLKKLKVAPKPPSRPQSLTRQHERNSESDIRRSTKERSRPTARRSATSSPRSGSPTLTSPSSIPKRLKEDSLHRYRSSHSELRGGSTTDTELLESMPVPKSSSKKTPESSNNADKGRRPRSSSLLSLENPPKPELADFPKRATKSKLSAFTRPTEQDLALHHSYSYSPRASPRSSKASSPVEEPTSPWRDSKSNVSRTPTEYLRPEPASPMIDALNIDYFRRAAAPTKLGQRTSTRKEPATRSHRMSLDADDIKDVPERFVPAASRLKTVSTPESKTDAAVEPKSVKEAKEATSATLGTTHSTTTKTPEQATTNPSAPKGRASKPPMFRTMSGRGFADPWKALTMDTKQLKALRSEANRVDTRRTQQSEYKKPTVNSATSSAATSPELSKSEPAKAEYISATTPRTAGKGKGAKSQRRKGKISWYKTLNVVEALHDLKHEFSQHVHGPKRKGILKGPGDLKRDPGTPAGKAAKDSAAQFTKISRRVVCPEALELGHEKFEIKGDDVVVLRMLSKQEIEGYAGRSRDIRGMSCTARDCLCTLC